MEYRRNEKSGSSLSISIKIYKKRLSRNIRIQKIAKILGQVERRLTLICFLFSQAVFSRSFWVDYLSHSRLLLRPTAYLTGKKYDSPIFIIPFLTLEDPRENKASKWILVSIFCIMDHGGGGANAPKAPMIYICGECHGENEIRPRDAIRCRECGYRIMYKKRTKRLIVFDAR